MERSAPSRLAKARELLDQLRICVALDSELTDILEEINNHLYAVDEDIKRMVATSRRHTDQINSLESRYSQILYRIAELSHQSRS